jgi:multiple sugar transport system ATP-binding protein
MANVILKDITKKFDEVVAVNDVSLEIRDREFVVLVGPSGCGKTTTLRMIAGLEQITRGEIYIGDRLVNRLPPKDRNIAMVFQSYALYPHMKVFDNMAFGLKMRKVPRGERQTVVNESAEILGIKELLNRKPRQLSGGQRQRVALGRAIVRKPEVFLFDEPLSNLDAKLRVQMRTELKKLHERLQATTVYVTHDQVEAMTMGDRIVVMKDGIVQQVGSPLELYNKPRNAFVAGFIGSPAMNFIPCRIQVEDSTLFVKTSDFKVPVPDTISGKIRPFKDEEFVFGIRPEDIQEIKPNALQVGSGVVKSAKVNVVETLGKEICLDLTTGEHTLTALVGADADISPHQEIDLELNMQKSHLFRAIGGEAIF